MHRKPFLCSHVREETRREVLVAPQVAGCKRRELSKHQNLVEAVAEGQGGLGAEEVVPNSRLCSLTSARRRSVVPWSHCLLHSSVPSMSISVGD